ncbi:MAG: hypothetical protein H9533_05800 [Rhodobacteraceae bacterium]|nr:hypothetical protein [Paracoccaceae bacterium]
MTMTQYFDTHRAATKLKQAGFEETKVEALIDILRDTSKDDHLVTREYLDNRLLQTEQRMTIRLGGLIIAAATILGLVARYLPPPG